MSNLIGNLEFEVFDDGTINVKGQGLGIENASYTLGSIINDMLAEMDKGSYEKMEAAHDCVRMFAEGLTADYMAAAWRETAKELPIPASNKNEFPVVKEVLFTTEERRVYLGVYNRKDKTFRNTDMQKKFSKDDVPYWMPMPVAPLGRKWHEDLDKELKENFMG